MLTSLPFVPQKGIRELHLNEIYNRLRRQKTGFLSKLGFTITDSRVLGVVVRQPMTGVANIHTLQKSNLAIRAIAKHP